MSKKVYKWSVLLMSVLTIALAACGTGSGTGGGLGY
jgi:predicted small lipoprotein YifL